MDDAKAEAEAAREQAVRQVAAEERTETFGVANRLNGDPLGELSRARADESAADDLCRDLPAQLAKAEAKRARMQGNVEFSLSGCKR